MATSLERFAQSHECATCQGGSVLTVRWSPELRAEQVWCPRCRNTERFTQRLSTTERWRRGEPVSIAVANKLERKYGGGPVTTTDLARMDAPTMLQRMEKARFLKALSNDDKAALAAAAIDYGYDPVMREITLYEGNLYITSIGHMNRAARNRAYAGLEVRPMSAEERELYKMQDVPYAYIAKCYKRGFAVPSVGTGTANPSKPYRNNPLERDHPEWMAESRAVRRAIRPYFPPKNPFAPLEDEDFVAAGEIIEGEAREIPADAPFVPVSVEPEPGGFTTDFPDDDDIGPDGTPEPAQAEIEAERRKEIKDIYTTRKWIWEDFLAKFQTSYKVEFDKANLTQLDDALEKIRAALAAKKGTTAA